MIEHDCERNKWLEATEAVEYGCVDKVLEHMSIQLVTKNSRKEKNK